MTRNKEGLDLLVEIRGKMQRDTVREDRRLLEEQKARIKREIQMETENMRKKKSLAKELLDLSLKDKALRQEKVREAAEREKREFKARQGQLERAQRELAAERKREKSRTGKEVQDYYERHLAQKRSREARERAQDKEFLAMEIAKLEKEERARVDFFEKIKSGYKQNHQVQRKYAEFFEVG